ncbi:MAG: TRAP transporter large permease [Rhodobiaceae bacterium]|nr:TRAP transporter large permease [Rhodobiaceae bacterium]MCC0057323.1 TRAP transporter large permease [Rhodobiaceae bacterium]
MTEMLFGLLAMIVLMIGGMPVGFAMILVGFIGTAWIYGWNWTAAIALMGIEPYANSSSYLFIAIPLFILMGHFAIASGISREMFEAARAWFGHWRGGLAVATVGASAGFSAACGSSLATAAAMGTLSIPEMRKHGVHVRVATAVVAAGGTLGILIPPSIGMVLYGLVADQSIGRLLVAGILPGVMLAILFMITVVILAYLRPADLPRMEKYPLSRRIRETKGVTGILILFLIVMGGIYGGIFTPTEAAGIGAGGAYIIVLLRARRLDWAIVSNALRATGEATCMIFMIIIGSHVLNVFLAATRGPVELSQFVESLNLSPTMFMIIVLIMYLILGSFLDALAMIVLTIPILLPVLSNMGYDLIWFGVIVVLVMEMALITPPVGLCVYVIKGVAKDVPIHVIFSGVWPFLMAQIVMVAVLLAYPHLALILPNLMYE